MNSSPQACAGSAWVGNRNACARNRPTLAQKGLANRRPWTSTWNLARLGQGLPPAYDPSSVQ